MGEAAGFDSKRIAFVRESLPAPAAGPLEDLLRQAGFELICLDLEQALSETATACDLLIVTPDQPIGLLKEQGWPVLVLESDWTAEGPESLAQRVERRLEQGVAARPGPTLSVCMIVKDEEKNLRRALRSVSGLVSEVVVVDTGSTDSTPEIARQFGAKVLFQPWTGDFAAARNRAVAEATGDWVLVLDADEAVSEEFRAGIRETLARTIADGLAIPIVNMRKGAAVQRFDGVRLFRNGKGYQFRGRIHEQVTPTIIGAGGRLGFAELPLLHYGYTVEENQRKDRRERNLRLLREAHAEDPTEPLYWHYLGAESHTAQDFAEAKRWFHKLLSAQPDYALAGVSAYMLAEIHLIQRNTTAAWDTATVGINSHYGHVGCLIRMAEAALLEGDFVTGLQCVTELEKVLANANGDTWRRDSAVAEFRALSLWEQGRRAESLEVWKRHVLVNPTNTRAADLWIRRVEQVAGYRAATVEAVREIPTPQVHAASAGVSLRQQNLQLVSNLAERAAQAGYWTSYHASALLRTGSRELGIRLAKSLGLEGAIHLVLSGLDVGDTDLVESGLEDAPVFWGTVAAHVLTEQQVPRDLEWALSTWMKLSADYRMDDLFFRMASLLPGTTAEQKSKAALLFYEAERQIDALKLALECPDQKEAQQIIGLIAFDQNDWQGAAQFLSLRAQHGDAPVKVYWRGAQALLQSGRRTAAQALLEQGRRARPLSLLLAQS